MKIRKLLAPYRRQMLETKALFDSLDLPEIPPSAPSIGRYKMYLADGKIAEGDLVSITLDGKVRRA